MKQRPLGTLAAVITFSILVILESTALSNRTASQDFRTNPTQYQLPCQSSAASAMLPAYDEPTAPLDFPRDHGFHFNLVEWVYFSGIVQTEEGKELGFMFTIFQYGPKRPLPVTATNPFVYPCLLVIIDPDAPQYHWWATPGLTRSVQVEEGVPSVTVGSQHYELSESGDFIIQAAMGNLSIDLTLTPVMDVLLHGEDGIITMGDGNSSGYYSFTNLETRGTLSIEGVKYTVSSGRTWMDHQWGNFTDYKWDWFSLRLGDGAALMLFQLRDCADNVVGGNWTYRDAGGAIQYGRTFSLESHRTYRATPKVRFPMGWTISIPDIDAEFEISPLFDAQNMYSLWEGMCSVTGTAGDSALSGNAFVELSGY